MLRFFIFEPLRYGAQLETQPGSEKRLVNYMIACIVCQEFPALYFIFHYDHPYQMVRPLDCSFTCRASPPLP